MALGRVVVIRVDPTGSPAGLVRRPLPVLRCRVDRRDVPADASHLDQCGETFNADHPERAGVPGLQGIRWDLRHLFLDPVALQVAELRALVAGRSYEALVADVGFVTPPPFTS